MDLTAYPLLSSGLFQGAMTLSGNALCDHYIQKTPQEAAVELATRLECTSEKGEDIVKCLRRQTQQDIVKKSQDMYVSTPNYVYSSERLILASTDSNP